MEDQPPGYLEATANSAAQAEAQAPLKGQETKYALISLACSDRIRLVRFPEPITALVSEVLQCLWPKGIQNVRPFDDSLEIKLKGNPFTYENDTEKIALRVVILGILNAFAKEGWCVVPGAGGLGRLGNYSAFGQRDSIIFQLTEPKQYSWLCVSFDSSDLIHLINAPNDLATGLIDMFGGRVERCNKDLVSGNFELKFKDRPWSVPSGKGAIKSGLVVLDLVQCLQENGYTICSTLDLDGGSGGSAYQSSGETWFCYR